MWGKKTNGQQQWESVKPTHSRSSNQKQNSWVLVWKQDYYWSTVNRDTKTSLLQQDGQNVSVKSQMESFVSCTSPHKNGEPTDHKPVNWAKTRTPDWSAFLSSASDASELEKCVMSDDVTTGHVISRLFHHSFFLSLFPRLNCPDLEDFNTKNKMEKQGQRLEFAGFRSILRNSVRRWTNGFHEDPACFQDTGLL